MVKLGYCYEMAELGKYGVVHPKGSATFTRLLLHDHACAQNAVEFAQSVIALAMYGHWQKWLANYIPLLFAGLCCLHSNITT